uniref:Uncharacterized protein n=1 Tax=Rhizophora mucronata TaxID=61149 RepID=A0A2P2P6C5_RHIMU
MSQFSATSTNYLLWEGNEFQHQLSILLSSHLGIKSNIHLQTKSVSDQHQCVNKQLNHKM